MYHSQPNQLLQLFEAFTNNYYSSVVLFHIIGFFIVFTSILFFQAFFKSHVVRCRKLIFFLRKGKTVLGSTKKLEIFPCNPFISKEQLIKTNIY